MLSLISLPRKTHCGSAALNRVCLILVSERREGICLLHWAPCRKSVPHSRPPHPAIFDLCAHFRYAYMLVNSRLYPHPDHNIKTDTWLILFITVRQCLAQRKCEGKYLGVNE